MLVQLDMMYACLDIKHSPPIQECLYSSNSNNNNNNINNTTGKWVRYRSRAGERSPVPDSATNPAVVKIWTRPNQFKPGIRSEKSRERRQKRTDKKEASKGHRRDQQETENTNRRNKQKATTYEDKGKLRDPIH